MSILTSFIQFSLLIQGISLWRKTKQKSSKHKKKQCNDRQYCKVAKSKQRPNQC